MVYTCYDMIQDCRADRPKGWRYFIIGYVPIIQELLRHYYPIRSADAGLLKRVLLALRSPDASLFEVLSPLPEREFVAELRQAVLGLVEKDGASPQATIPLDLATLSSALEQFTSTEKQVVWLETMRYDPEPSGHMMQMHSGTVEKTRERAADSLRGTIDTWRRSMIADNGPVLRLLALQVRTEGCYMPRTFFDALDGRITWRQREDLDHHLNGCWHCVDLFCRLRESQALLRKRKPLTREEAQPFRQLLGVPQEPQPVSLWKMVAKKMAKKWDGGNFRSRD